MIDPVEQSGETSSQCGDQCPWKDKAWEALIDKQTWRWDEEVQATIKEKKRALKMWFQTRTDDNLHR